MSVGTKFRKYLPAFRLLDTRSATLTDEEIAYIKSQPLARIAAVAPDGRPDVAAVGFEFDNTHFYIGGFNPTNTRRSRNVRNGNHQVTLVIDDLKSIQPWTRGSSASTAPPNSSTVPASRYSRSHPPPPGAETSPRDGALATVKTTLSAKRTTSRPSSEPHTR
jgi:PPOX class F420-dependent enzyme/OxyR family protein